MAHHKSQAPYRSLFRNSIQDEIFHSKMELTGGAILALLALLRSSVSLSANLILTHEEIVDVMWSSEIRSHRLQHHPDLTPEQVTEAHAAPMPHR
jgi:hypothetical protein